MVVVLKPDLLKDLQISKRVFRPHTSTIKVLLLKTHVKSYFLTLDPWTGLY